MLISFEGTESGGGGWGGGGGGIKQLMCVCWVSDPSFCTLFFNARFDLFLYLGVVSLHYLHPSRA